METVESAAAMLLWSTIASFLCYDLGHAIRAGRGWFVAVLVALGWMLVRSVPDLYHCVRLWWRFGKTGPALKAITNATIETLIRRGITTTPKRRLKLKVDEIMGFYHVTLEGGSR